jgi:hypothetical protein
MWRKNALTLAAAAVAACGGDFTGPVPPEVAGEYQVSEFFYSENGTTWDLAAEGSIIELHLFQNGTTGGRIFVPAASATAQDYEADLAGVWMVNNDTVYVTQTIPTIISSMGLVINGDQLHGEQQFGAALIRVTLVR